MHKKRSKRREASSGSGWIWLVLLGMAAWWLFRRFQQLEMETSSGEPGAVLPARETHKDDLTRLEGIGPKVAKLLNEAGITDFEALSKASVEEIQKVLNEAGLPMLKPEGWIDQAYLAARGDWDGLQKLQGELQGGRRK
jgi:large subunit ribosomal protein L21